MTSTSFTSAERALMSSLICGAVLPMTDAPVSALALAVDQALEDAFDLVDDHRERHQATPRSEDHPVLMHVVRSMSKNGPAV